MDKKHLRKNVLDLRYHSESQKINAILVICSVGILAFIGTFIWYHERLYYGMMISILIMLISFFFYKRTKKQMNKILSEIEEL
jgi:amino acid permease